jgi:peptidoglycan/LPS O-acetylase OafA/YrhL
MKPAQPMTPNSNIPSLTGVRFFAALGVMALHFSIMDYDKHKYFNWGPFNPFIMHGGVGVDLFFVLSGFILSHAYRETFRVELSPKTWLGFIRNRFARIYPLHFVTMLVTLLLFMVGRRMGVDPRSAKGFTLISFLANLTMTHAWLPSVTAAINLPAWSISAEWFAYLLFPFLCAWIVQRSAWWPAALMVITICLMASIPGLPPLGLVSVEFSFGVAAYELAVRSKFALGPWAAWAGVILAIFSVYALNPLNPDGTVDINPSSHLRTGMMLASGLLFASLSRSKSTFSRFLSWPPVVYGGEISFSIYMCHFVVWTIVHKGLWHTHLFHGLAHVWAILLAFVITIPVSMAGYHFVELPGRSAIRRTFIGSPKPAIAWPALHERGEGGRVTPAG